VAVDRVKDGDAAGFVVDWVDDGRKPEVGGFEAHGDWLLGPGKTHGWVENTHGTVYYRS